MALNETLVQNDTQKLAGTVYSAKLNNENWNFFILPLTKLTKLTKFLMEDLQNKLYNVILYLSSFQIK